MRTVPLEPAAEELCNISSIPPLIFQLPPAVGRQKLETAQNSSVFKYPALILCEQIDVGAWGNIPLYFISPENIESGKVLFFIYMVLVGCLEAFIHMKS